jgi:hypothetical protein
VIKYHVENTVLSVVRLKIVWVVQKYVKMLESKNDLCDMKIEKLANNDVED